VASDSNVLLPVKPVKQNITDKENYTVQSVMLTAAITNLIGIDISCGAYGHNV